MGQYLKQEKVILKKMIFENTDILLDENGDDLIKNGDYAVGDGVQDDCVIILKLNKGALKSDPLLGPNLVSMTNGKNTKSDMEQAVRISLERDGKRPTKVVLVDGKIQIAL
jgi:hypothetical protein